MSDVTARLDRLALSLRAAAARHEPVNIRFLTGFDSSNAALLVDPKGPVKLFTDFRYIEAAEQLRGRRRGTDQAVDDARPAEAAQGQDRLRGRHPAVLAGRDARLGGLDLVPVTGVVEALRAIKDEDEIAKIAPRGPGRRPRLRGADGRDLVGRSEREIAWRLRQLLHAHGVDHLSFDTAIAPGRTARSRTASQRRHHRDADARHRRLGRPARRLLLRLHAHPRDRRAPRRAARDLRRVPRVSARGSRPGSGPG